MTVAVCLKCGSFKHGAWTPCPQCRYTPDDDESYTKHLLVTDHFLNQAQLEEVAAGVKAGKPVEFPPEVLKQAWVRKADVDKANRGCALSCVAVLLAVIAGAVGYIVWQMR